VSAVETPPPPAPETERRACPRCGSPLTPEQEWCLECGADVGSTLAPPPSWRGPVALVAALLTVAAVALILALVELASGPEQVSEQPVATPTPTPTAVATATPTTTAPPSTTIPPATDDGTTPATPEIADWPAGKEAWTVVLESSATREAAETRAKELAQQGVPVGLLDSNDYSSLEPNRFVVFSGQYDSRRAADQAMKDLSNQVDGAYVRHVAPSATASPPPSAEP
jgi:SPOR domain